MIKFYVDEFWKSLGDFSILRRTDPKQAFELLARCTKYKFFAGKREGGLLKKIMENGEIISGDDMAEKVINHYKEVHKLPENEFNKAQEIINFPKNFKLSREQVLEIFNWFKRDKAFCADGFNN